MLLLFAGSFIPRTEFCLHEQLRQPAFVWAPLLSPLQWCKDVRCLHRTQRGMSQIYLPAQPPQLSLIALASHQSVGNQGELGATEGWWHGGRRGGQRQQPWHWLSSQPFSAFTSTSQGCYRSRWHCPSLNQVPHRLVSLEVIKIAGLGTGTQGGGV